MAGLYIHIPFCKQACTYCNFHFSTNLSAADSMVACINRELSLRQPYLQGEALTSVYLGGGTPSLLSSRGLRKLMDGVHGTFEVSSDAEITIEANPDDITVPLLEDLAQVGVNRLSLGVQSFHDDDLTFMNRAHNGSQSRKAIELALDKGFDNFSVDLIYGVPGLGMDDWKRNVDIVVDYGIKHISCYALTVEEGTVLGHLVQKGKVTVVEDELVEQQFVYLMDRLEGAGFEHYEISNFALPGFQAVHNTNYWKNSPYLGVGPSAHSYNGVSRSWNVANNMQYMKAIREDKLPVTSEKLTKTDQYNEYVMTRLRTMWGCHTEEITAFGPEYLSHFHQHIEAPREVGHITQKGREYRLTRKGKLFADRIASDLFYVS